MAKKKKQKKAGIANRQKNKKQKKVAQKRKLVANKPVQKKISQSKVKQNLKNLPSLVFESELLEIAFSEDELKQAISAQENVPDQIEAIATPAFTEKLLTQLETMKLRFEKTQDVNKIMMVHAILYFMEQEDAPAFLNQIIVGMFYYAKFKLESPDVEITLKDLNQSLKQYDQDWESYLQEKMDQMAAPEGEEDPIQDDEDAVSISPSHFEPLVEEFETHLESKEEIGEEVKDRAIEDIEVLFNDYFEEKEITQIEDVRLRKIKNFLDGWFIRMMHPTKEDLEFMIDALELFFNFALEKEKISADTCNEIITYLTDRENILSKLEV